MLMDGTIHSHRVVVSSEAGRGPRLNIHYIDFWERERHLSPLGKVRYIAISGSPILHRS